MNPFGRTNSCILIALYTGEKLSRKVSLLSYTGKFSCQKSVFVAEFMFFENFFFAFWTTSVRIDQTKMTPEIHPKHARILDQFVYNEHEIYKEHIVFFIFHFLGQKHIFVEFFFK